MKILLKNFTAMTFAIACCLLLPTNTVRAEDEPLPPEVKALIGMNIPPKIVGKKGGNIPNFIRVSERNLNKQIGDEKPGAELGYEEGLLNEKWLVFIVSASHKDRTLEILDVQMLPENLINWRYENGKVKGIGNRFEFSYCHSSIDYRRIILGLVKPENDNE